MLRDQRSPIYSGIKDKCIREKSWTWQEIVISDLGKKKFYKYISLLLG